MIGLCNSTEEDNWAIIYYCLDENHSSRGVGSRRRYIQMAEKALIEGKINFFTLSTIFFNLIFKY